jgi:hypothetical protein
MELDQFYSTVVDLIRKGHKELLTYDFKLRDLSEVGIPSYMEDQRRINAWQSRVMAMMSTARQLRGRVEKIAKAKEEYVDIEVQNKITELQASDGFPNVKMHKDQQVAWVKKIFTAEREDAANWKELLTELRSFLDQLEARMSCFGRNLNDLRSQLWALRLQGQTGELANEGQNLERDVQGPYFKKGETLSTNLGDLAGGLSVTACGELMQQGHSMKQEPSR